MTNITNKYASIHKIRSLDHATEEDLRLLIQTYPIIDNHAHNLLREEHAQGGADYPFECITSEAQGHALLDHGSTALAHMRGVKQLAELFECPETLQDIKAARYEWLQKDYAGLIEKCFDGIHAIMMDDGLSPEIIHPVRWHDKYVPRASRIVRIEMVAAEMLEQLAISAGFLKPGTDGDWNKDQSEAFLSRFNNTFRSQIRTLAQDPHVRGFKSVVCYRSGLDISLESRNLFRPRRSLSESALVSTFHKFIQQAVRTNKYRVDQKEINDFLVVTVCDVLDKLVDSDGETLPFQFHTGLGDTDLDLVKANPAYMQPLIEAFPNVDFVILHSSYPYTREAGYLAANFSNAWLDIGEVFPMLSRDGEETVLRHALELTPTSKILWSTDGHFYPESYYLANRQFRTALEKVMLEYVRAGDITVKQAVDSAVDIMFWNSSMLYKLDEERRYPQLLEACGRSSGGSIRTLANGHPRSSSIISNSATLVTTSPDPPSMSTRTTQQLSSGAVTETGSDGATDNCLKEFDEFVRKNPSVKYIWVQAIDYTGTTRQRMVPISQFRKHISSGKYPGMLTALPRLSQTDTGAEGFSATGEFKLMFDTSTLSLNKVIDSPSATVQTWWMNDTSTPPTEHCHSCPRWTLRRLLNTLEREYGLHMLMGFEIEIIFMRPVMNESKTDFKSFEPLSAVHSWAGMSYHQLDTLPVIEEIVQTLAELDIHLPQFHAEAAPGQWEFPLPAFEPLTSIDVLYKAREVIRMVTRKHGLKATLYPRPYSTAPGSACHTHFSINGSDELVEKYSDPFLAGILEHLSAILAMSLPIEESYQRMMAGIWAGGVYATWGTSNREVPLRKCGPGHWELRPVDGMGNMYLTIAALVAAGLSGLEQDLPLTIKDCAYDASQISEEQRAELGIKSKLPQTLQKSLKCLDADSMLREKLGDAVVDDYLAVKEAEIKTLGAKGEEERKLWLIARY